MKRFQDRDKGALVNQHCLCYYNLMLQRSLLICGVAATGLAAFLLGETTHLTATVSLLGTISVPSHLLLLVGTVLAVFGGGFDSQHGTCVTRIEAGLRPSLLTFGFFMAGKVITTDIPAWLLVAALAVVLMVLLLAQGESIDQGNSALVRLCTIKAVLYVAALAMFTGIYSMALPMPWDILAMGVVAILLALLIQRNLVSALVVGLVTAETAWPLRYWPVSAPVVGSALLVVFYTTAGLLAMAQNERVDRMAVGYVATGTIALTIIVAAVLRL